MVRYACKYLRSSLRPKSSFAVQILYKASLRALMVLQDFLEKVCDTNTEICGSWPLSFYTETIARVFAAISLLVLKISLFTVKMFRDYFCSEDSLHKQKNHGSKKNDFGFRWSCCFNEPEAVLVSIPSLVKAHVTDAVMRSAHRARRRPFVSVQDETVEGVGAPSAEELEMENAYPPSVK